MTTVHSQGSQVYNSLFYGAAAEEVYSELLNAGLAKGPNPFIERQTPRKE